jgi:hypothetical protein
MKPAYLTIIAASMALSACASSDPTNDPSYVSLVEYQNYSCKQITAEMNRISKRTDDAMEVRVQANKNDQTNAVLGAAVTALAITQGYSLYSGSDRDDNAIQINRLKSQYDALERLAIQKNCI